MKPPGEVLRAGDYEVRTADLAIVRRLVEQLHYAGSAANTATFRHALYRRGDGEPLGAAQWLPPTKGAARAMYPEGDWRRVLALSRLVIDPRVPTNGATFLMRRSIRAIAAAGGWACLVTYADTGQGHTGAIYRAAGWEYMGMTAPQTRWVDADGRIVSRLATRSRTVAQMLELGYVRAGSYAKHRFRIVL